MDAEHPEQASRGHEEQLQTLARENVSLKTEPPDVPPLGQKVKTPVDSFQVQLREETERLLAKVSYLEGRVEHLSGSRAELSSRLVRSQEDKLKVQLKIRNFSSCTAVELPCTWNCPLKF